MKTDPRVRKNGRCAQCGGDRTPAKGLSGQTGTFAQIFADAVKADPFCSTRCCREWHDLPLTTAPTSSLEQPLPMVTHGTVTRYRKGCRCDACRQAEAERAKRRRAELRELKAAEQVAA